MDRNAYVAVPMDGLTSPGTGTPGAASSGRRRRWMELEYLWLVVLLGAALCFFLATALLLAHQSHESYATISLPSSQHHNNAMTINHGHMRGNMGGTMHHPYLKHHKPQRPTHDRPKEHTLEELYKDELQQETVERVNEGEHVEEEETYLDEDSEEDQMTLLHKDGSYVVKLTVENFDEFLDQHDVAFIDMFAPWCMWSQRLAPTWEKFAKEVAKNDDMPIGVASIDCVDQKELCSQKQHVMAYPTLRWFQNKQAVRPDYKMDRTVEALMTFAQRKLELYSGPMIIEKVPEGETWERYQEPKEKSSSGELDSSFSKESSDEPKGSGGYFHEEAPPEEELEKLQHEPAMVEHINEGEESVEEEEDHLGKDSEAHEEEKPHKDRVHVVKLTADNIDEFLEHNQMAFIDMFTPWCVWCQRLAPTWEKFAQKVAENDLPIGVASIDCVDQADLCRKQHVMAFPTLRWFENTQATSPDYKMDRTVAALMGFAKRKLDLYNELMIAEKVPEGEMVDDDEVYQERVEEDYAEEEDSPPDALEGSYLEESLDEPDSDEEDEPPEEEIEKLQQKLAMVERVNEGD